MNFPVKFQDGMLVAVNHETVFGLLVTASTQGVRGSQEQNVGEHSLVGCERASMANPGAYKLWFSWPCCKGTKNATLFEIFEMENGARALIEISEWSKTDADAKNFIAEFMAIDAKRKAVFDLVREKMKAERKRGRQRIGDTHANRERQAEFGF